MDKRYQAAEPSVVSEVIDGEAIIMDLRSGAYYSADGLGALLWGSVIEGATCAELTDWAKAAFPTASEAHVKRDVQSFVDELVAKELVVARSGAGAAGFAADTAGMIYRRPTLEKHEDMQDLIMLDPIHDVDDAGWPTRKVDTPTT